MSVFKVSYFVLMACAMLVQKNALEILSDGSKDKELNEVTEKDLQKIVDLLFQNKSILKLYVKTLLENFETGELKDEIKQISDKTPYKSRVKRQVNCPRGWSSYGDACYLVVNIERNWEDAASACKDAGGDLATSNVEEINNYLSSLVWTNDLYFIGLRYIGKLGYFKWNDGRVLNWSNWFGESPVNNPTGSDCVAILSDGFWRDIDCNSQHRYICQASPSEAVELGRDPEGEMSTIYTRWGRTDCPVSAELVYQGIVGGAHYNQPGSGANYLCMPLVPTYNQTRTGTQGGRGRLYGAEYQAPGFPLLAHLHNHSPPCAVCRRLGRSQAMMLPARLACPQPWSLEYSGWLMSAKYSVETKTEYICVDQEPEIMPDTATNVNGILLYLVESMCSTGGGLPCGQGEYVQGNELTCALCTI